MNDFLVSYLDAIDERLLDYLGEDDELLADCVQRLLRYAVALSDNSLTPAVLAEDWPDWFHLALAFVAAYGIGELEDLEQASSFLEAVEQGEVVALTPADRAYLVELAAQLDMYPESREG